MDGSLLESVFVFLAAACVLVPLSKLSGLGSVIGYLIAGVIIGPAALGFIREPETILHFSEFGVVMMLFIIGLELKPKALWDMKRKLIGLGGAQVFITSALIALAAKLVGLSLGESIVVGMALALSSTAIAVQVMQDRGMMLTETGRSAFSVLLFQDVIVIAMIASLPFLAVYSGLEPAQVDSHGDTGHGLSGLALVGAMFAVFGGMIIGGRVLLRPLFRLIAKSKVRETFTAIALLLVVGSALLMGLLGLSPALGAFIGGVVLADSEYRHQLERDIEPFKALLMGLFFMSVGMSLNFGAIMENPLGIIAIVAGLIAVKFLVLLVIGKGAKLHASGNLLFASLLSQAGEFGFVLFSFARAEGAMSGATATVLTAVIALTMALTPIIIILYDKIIAPRMAAPKMTGDAPVNHHNKVLILGFGRVGQVVSRLLQTQDIDATIIDHDGEQIEFVKQFGHQVYYGDGADVDLLRTAGAGEAEIIVIAIDSRDKATKAAKEIKEHFPHVKIIGRARNRGHMFDLMAEEIDFAERETVRGSLAMGRVALEYLGVSEQRARELSDDFLTHDFKLIEETYQLRGNMDALAARAQDGRNYLKQVLNADKGRELDHEEPDE